MDVMMYLVVAEDLWATGITKVEALTNWTLRAGTERIESVQRFRVYRVNEGSFMDDDGRLFATVAIDLPDIEASEQLKHLLLEILEDNN